MLSHKQFRQQTNFTTFSLRNLWIKSSMEIWLALCVISWRMKTVSKFFWKWKTLRFQGPYPTTLVGKPANPLSPPYKLTISLRYAKST